MKFSKIKIAAIAALALCATALNSLADPPSSSYSPRNSILFNGLFISNAVPATTNIGTWTNIVLTSPSQHNMSITTVMQGTNTIPAAYNYTNYFDLGKIVNSNGVLVTNWTTDTPIVVIGTGTAAANSNNCQARILSPTNFDNYDLIRLTKAGSNATNAYNWEVILGQ